MPFRGNLFSRLRGFARDQYFATRRGWRRALPRSAPPRNAFVHCLVRRGALGDRAPPRFATCCHARGARQSTRLAGRVVPKSQTKAERLRHTSLRMSLPRGLRGTHHTMDDASRSLHQGRDLRARRIRALPRARHGEVGRDLRARRFRACRVRPAARTPPQRRDFSRSDGSTATAREKGWDYDYD